ncbi:MAG: hypothetical protein LBM66_00840 [Bifidobacteriaceae bacterium]|nr:hypothetical protein [Bifidobacteriaceae bacterium]
MRAIATVSAAGALALTGLGLAMTPASADTPASTPSTSTATTPASPAASMLSLSTWAPAAAGDTTQVAVTASASWRASSSARWLTVTPATGTAAGAITLTAAANTTACQRVALVLVRSGRTMATVTVTQAADDHGDTLWTATAWDVQTAPSVTGTLISTGDRDVFAVQVPYRGSYVFTATPADGSVAGTLTGPFGLPVQTTGDLGTGLTASLQQGTYYLTVTAGATLTAPAGYTVTATVPAETPSTLSAAQTAFSLTGGRTVVSTTVSTNESYWTAQSSDSSWLQVTPMGVNGGTLAIVACQNTTAAARTATVTLAAGTATATVTVTQAAAATDDYGNTRATAQAWDVSTSVQMTGSLEQAGDVDVFAVTVPWDGNYTFSGQVSPATAGPVVVTLSTSRGGTSATSDASTGAFTLTASLKAGKTYYLTVSSCNPFQQLAAIGYTLTATVPPQGESVTASAPCVTLDSTGAGSVTITSNPAAWTATSSASWLQTTASGNSGDALALTATANSSWLPRIATVTVTAGTATTVITVVQPGTFSSCSWFCW